MKPNHICKNSNCTKGSDGKPKHYYACDYCDATLAWRSVACCIECYEEYIKQVRQARKHTKVDEIKLAKDKTLDELKDYKDDIETIGLEKTIDKINKENEEKSNGVKEKSVSNKSNSSKSYNHKK